MTTPSGQVSDRRAVTVAAVAGAGAALLAALVVRVLVWSTEVWFPSPDANIGLGLLLLAARSVVISLGLWASLRWLEIRRAGWIAVGSFVVSAALLCVPAMDPIGPVGILIDVVAMSGYAAGAVAVAHRVAAMHND